MPRFRYVNGKRVEEPLHHETVQAIPLEEQVRPPVALPEDGWSSDPGRNARKRRGITGAAKALRDEVIRNGNPDPGSQACVDRVSDAVATSERRSG